MSQSNEETWPDDLAAAACETRHAVRGHWLYSLVRRLLEGEPEMSTNERMRRVLGRPEVAGKPNCRLIEEE